MPLVKIREGEVNIVSDRMIVLTIMARADDAAVEVMLLDCLLLSIEYILDSALVICTKDFGKFSDWGKTNLPPLTRLLTRLVEGEDAIEDVFNLGLTIS